MPRSSSSARTAVTMCPRASAGTPPVDGRRGTVAGNTSAVALAAGEPALRDHAVEDEVPALHGLVRVDRGVPPRRRLDQPGEQRRPRLAVRSVTGLAEVGVRRGLDAVGAATEVDGVEVVAEDLVLAALLGDLDRDDHLPVLAPQRRLVADEGVLDVLLGDRRAAADAAAQLVPRRAQRSRSGRSPGWSRTSGPRRRARPRARAGGTCSTGTTIRLPCSGTSRVSWVPSA